jgi:23S rRNA (cytosine1962-C5)-methyltransferase
LRVEGVNHPLERFMGAITINGKAVGRLRAGHLWIFRDDLLDARAVEDGDVVSLLSQRGRPLGSALYSARSKIALRFVAAPDIEVNLDFWRDRLRAALAYRSLVVNRTSAFRLAFGEGDLLPSLILDRYGDTIVMQTLSRGMERRKEMWIELIEELLSPAALIERNDAKVRLQEELPLHTGLLKGNSPALRVCRINELYFEIDLFGGKKTGAFLDQRENYAAAESLLYGEVLDGFAYSGGFAMHAARNGARVTAIDSSSEALNCGRRNAELNQLKGIEWIEGNLFDYLKQFEMEGRKFDAVVLDPPAFAKNRTALPAALRGYKEINLRAIKLLKPGGRLVTCSCSYHVSTPLFLDIVASAAADAHRPLRVIEARSQARDHPVLAGMPETRYLKCLLAQVL